MLSLMPFLDCWNVANVKVLKDILSFISIVYLTFPHWVEDTVRMSHYILKLW